MLYAVTSVHCTVCIVHCALFVDRAVGNSSVCKIKQHLVLSVQYAVGTGEGSACTRQFDVQVFIVQCSVFSVQCSVFSVQCSVCSFLV